MASAEGNPLLTAVAVAALAAAAFYAVDAAYDWSDERIAANERARVVARLNSVLEPALRGRDLTTTLLAVTDAELLGSDEPVDVFVLTRPRRADGDRVRGGGAARLQRRDRPPDRRIAGRHRDRRARSAASRDQGLGDAIDDGEERLDRCSSTAKRLTAPPPELWAIEQDEGEFDSISGATVTSRAVVDGRQEHVAILRAASRRAVRARRQPRPQPRRTSHERDDEQLARSHGALWRDNWRSRSCSACARCSPSRRRSSTGLALGVASAAVSSSRARRCPRLRRVLVARACVLPLYAADPRGARHGRSTCSRRPCFYDLHGMLWAIHSADRRELAVCSLMPRTSRASGSVGFDASCRRSRRGSASCSRFMRARQRCARCSGTARCSPASSCSPAKAAAD